MKVKFLRFWVWVSRPTLIGHLVPFFRNNSQGNWENDCNFNYTYSPHLLFLTPFKPYKTRVHSIHLPFRQPHKSQVYELAQLVTFKDGTVQQVFRDWEQELTSQSYLRSTTLWPNSKLWLLNWVAPEAAAKHELLLYKSTLFWQVLPTPGHSALKNPCRTRKVLLNQVGRTQKALGRHLTGAEKSTTTVWG